MIIIIVMVIVKSKTSTSGVGGMKGEWRYSSGNDFLSNFLINYDYSNLFRTLLVLEIN